MKKQSKLFWSAVKNRSRFLIKEILTLVLLGIKWMRLSTPSLWTRLKEEMQSMPSGYPLWNQERVHSNIVK